MSQQSVIGWNRYAVVTPSDTVDLSTSLGAPQGAKALYIGGTGNLVAVREDGTTVLFSALPVGIILPINCKRVNSTNTTATLIVALWDN